eukprot:CCRYP_009873-RA/>CCRYP_009873-RA protein AED:0.47 eAED:0.47 QI:0/-1/0/1/-1/1/1/0/89
MSSVKAIPEGLKWVECERGVGGKNSPIRYIPEQDPVQDALSKDKKTTYFKLTLPNTGKRVKGGSMGVRDSRAVSTACALRDSRMQADGA